MSRTMGGIAIRFVALLVVGDVLMTTDRIDAWIVTPWTSLNTAWSAALARLVGMEAAAQGAILSAGSASIDVKQGCNGLHALLIYACAVLAVPAPWARKLAGLLAGGAAILGFNLLRLVNLLAVARYAPARLELFHLYIWQTLIVILALATFLGWGVFIARGRAPAGGA